MNRIIANFRVLSDEVQRLAAVVGKRVAERRSSPSQAIFHLKLGYRRYAS
jgi:hypothetical protein